ncbi:hypothetical protein BC830DRAFT_1143331 [Chytriomyces sp. MP71]|nr:hypothetical protein BC830DRAFT_1143331 [Chytriomyces sp. MP71]
MSNNINLPPIFGKVGNIVASGQGSKPQQGLAPKRLGGLNHGISIASIAQMALEKKKRTMKLISKLNKDNILKDKALYRAEREINLNHFRELMTVFQERGNKSMTIDDFKGSFGKVLGEGLNEEQMALLFMKIDANTDNAIDWEEFSTFMLLRAERQSQMQEEAITQLFEVPNPMNPTPRHISPHRESIVNVLYLEHNRKYVTCSREGTVCFWSDKFRLQKCYLNVGLKTLTLDGREVMKLLGTNKNNPLLDRETPWIHDILHMKPLNKYAIASDNHEITFYHGTTWQSKIRFDLKDSVALCLDFWYDSDNPDVETCSLLFGTDGGYVYTVQIKNSHFANKDDNNKNKCLTIVMDQFGRGATKEMGSMTKRKAHDNWIGKIKYYHDWHAIVSCSIDPLASLVVAVQDGKNSWSYFSAPVNHGVNTFAYSRFPVALITGGTDHQLRLWNPHRLKNPMASFKGHGAPIIDLAVNEESGQVISLSVDNNIKIWDIRKQQCVQTLFDNEPIGLDDNLNRIYFMNHKLLALARNIIEYKLKERGEAGASAPKTVSTNAVMPTVKSHEFPLRAALYNPTFKQVVTMCDGGVVNVWDVLSGLHVFKFSETHGKSELTAATFDLGYRKLITGARDGTMYVWNFHNGQKIKEFTKPDSCEITHIRQIEMNGARYIISVGWNRRVAIYIDHLETDRENPSSTFPRGNGMWHDDDIMCLDFAPPNILVTASFDGGIVLSNLQSGHLMKKLRWPEWTVDSANRSIEQVVFLHERMSNPVAATLVTAGGDGVIRWWRTSQAELVWEMNGVPSREGESIYAMRTNSSNTLLITGDTQGWITIYGIKDTCIDDREQVIAPTVLTQFRAHVRSISSIDIVESNILTGSTDGTSRLFTSHGKFIGIFGQEQAWDINDGNDLSEYPPDVAAHTNHMKETNDAARARFRRASFTVLQKVKENKASSRPASEAGSDQRSAPIGDAFSDEESPPLSRSSSAVGLNTVGDVLTDVVLAPPHKRLSLSTYAAPLSRGTSIRDIENAAQEVMPPQVPPARRRSSIAIIRQRRRSPSEKETENMPYFSKGLRGIHTPELMQSDYKTWFGKSQFARSLLEQERQVEGRKKMRKSKVAVSMASATEAKLPSFDSKVSNAYHHLHPTDLIDFDVSRVTKLPAIVNQIAADRGRVTNETKPGPKAAANCIREEADSDHKKFTSQDYNVR